MQSRLFPRTLLFCALSFFLTQFVFAQQRPEPDYIEGRLIIKFKPSAAENTINATLSAFNARSVKKFKLIGAEVIEISNTTTARAISLLQNDPSVEYAHPDYIVRAIGPFENAAADSQTFPEDPRFPEYYGLHNTGQTGGTEDADIDAPEAWNITTGGSEVIIGVIDSGVDWEHEDLAANMWTNPGEIPNNGIDDDDNGFIDDVHGWDFANNDNNPFDDNGHGTHVAGTAAAVGNNGVGGAGVNWSARIMALKFLNASGSGSTSDAIAAVEYATAMGAHLTNNSWGGGPFEQALLDVIQASGDAGMLFIAAAGNDGTDNDNFPHYPSNYALDNIISVASTDHNDNRSGFSNFGLTSVDVGAPGSSILSTFPNNSYGVISGTSMASPHVAGLASLLLSYVPNLAPGEVKEAIMSSVDPLPALDGITVTGGRINAYNALMAVEQDSIPPDAISDLQIVSPGSNTMVLSWTASGDDTSDGTAKSYDVRFSTQPIFEGNFDEASKAANPPSPQEAGTVEEFKVTGLDFSTPYFFAIRVFDEQGNGSDISNVVDGSTLGAPQIAVEPDTLEAMLFTGEKAFDMFEIANVGEGTLDFVIPDFDEQASVRLVAAQGDNLHVQVLPTPSQKTRRDGVRQLQNIAPVQMGPSKATPLLRSVLANAGAEATVFYDDFEGEDQGWTIELYNNTTDALWHPTNSSFNSPETSWWCADEATGNYSTGSRISAAAVSPEISLSGALAPITLQFFENYNTETGFDRCMVDISTDGGTSWIPLRGDISEAPSGNSGGWIMTSLDISEFTGETIQVRFYFDTQDGIGNLFPGWFFDDVLITNANLPFISVTPNEGTVPANGMENIEVTFDAAGLFGDVYQADVIVESNDPDTPQAIVRALLTVENAPDIGVAPSELNFGEVFVGFSETLPFEVENAGTDTLNISEITSNNAVFSFQFSDTTLAPGDAGKGEVTFAPINAGEYSANLTFFSDDPDQPQFELPLSGEAVSPPIIDVSPAEINLFAKPGDSTFAALTIANNGGSDLVFSVGDEEQSVNAQIANHAVFWGVNTSVQDTLNCSDLDGSTVSSILVTPNTFLGIAIDEIGRRIYWASPDEGAIKSSAMDGGDLVTVVDGLFTPVDVAIDPVNQKLYWADFSANVISRANLDGSNEEVIINGANGLSNDPAGVTAAEKPSVANEKPDVISSPWGIALDLVHGKIYWTEQNVDRVSRANLDGSEVEICIETGLNGPRGIGYDPESNRVYFVDSFNNALKSFDTETKNATLVKQLGADDNPLALAIESNRGHVYWADNVRDYIARVDLEGNEFEVIAETSVPETDGPFGLAVASGGWLTESPNQGVVPAGESAEILVTADASALEEGDYEAVINVSSNDPVTSDVRIPVFLKVAQTEVIISTPDDIEGLVGDQLDVPVYLTINDSTLSVAVLGAAMKITGGLLSYVGFTKGDILTDQTFEVNPVSSDSLRMALSGFGVDPVSDSGVLATLHFSISQGAQTGDMATFEYNELSSADPTARSLVTIGIDGKATVFNELSIGGVVHYSRTDGSPSESKPVQGLDVLLKSGDESVGELKTDSKGAYSLENIEARKDYTLELRRVSGGRGFAVNPTDALVAFLGTQNPETLSGGQKLASDVDQNRELNLADATAIFDRFLGLVGAFEPFEWRAYPAAFDINETADSWKMTPVGNLYPNLRSRKKDQDFLAVVLGDANLSWVPVEESESLAKNVSPIAHGQPDLLMHIEKASVANSGLTAVQVVVSGDVLENGVYAFGGDVEFDDATFEIADVRWVGATPEDFQLAHRIHRFEDVLNDQEESLSLLRFGGFAKSEKGLSKNGVLLEIDLRTKKSAQAGVASELRIVEATASFRTSVRDNERVYTLQGEKMSLASAQVEVAGNEIVVSALPAEFGLEANYPNPFNPTTTIRYQLAEFAQVKLEIYNTVGQRIATLVQDEAQEAGFYSVEWNARDAAGAAVASGMYVYRIQAVYGEKKFVQTNKMLLLK